MIPDSVKVNDDKKSLLISYEKQNFLVLSSSVLRARSPSAENKKNLELQNLPNYKGILIDKVEKVGNYAIRIIFSDGHNTGIYSWQYLYEIGIKNQNS